MRGLGKRTGIVGAVVAIALIGGAVLPWPAHAASRTIHALAIAPMGSLTYGADGGLGSQYDGQVIGNELNVAAVHIEYYEPRVQAGGPPGSNHCTHGWIGTMRITTSDGSRLDSNLTGPGCAGPNQVVQGFLRANYYGNIDNVKVAVTGGTGRYLGAGGSGTLTLVAEGYATPLQYLAAGLLKLQLS